MTLDKHYHLPSREIAFHFTQAMFFGQQLELNLRALLWTADYHGWGVDLELTPEQIKRFKKTDSFIDEATCGAIISAIRRKGIIKEERLIQVFERACSHRNRLAHNFLSAQDFDNMTTDKESEIISQILNMTNDLYKAVRFSRAFRTLAEAEADKESKKIAELLEIDYKNPDAKYHTRTPKAKLKPDTKKT